MALKSMIIALTSSMIKIQNTHLEKHSKSEPAITEINNTLLITFTVSYIQTTLSTGLISLLFAGMYSHYNQGKNVYST